MSQNFRKNCLRCKEPGIEVIDDWESPYCPHCADVLVDRGRERREWDYYHPPASAYDTLPSDSEPAPEHILNDAGPVGDDTPISGEPK